jgi:hypothetical protein
VFRRTQGTIEGRHQLMVDVGKLEDVSAAAYLLCAALRPGAPDSATLYSSFKVTSGLRSR